MIPKDLAYVLGMQGKYEESQKYFDEAFAIAQSAQGRASDMEFAVTEGYLGAVLLNQGDLNKAEQQLTSSLERKRIRKDFEGPPEICIWLGQLYELKASTKSEHNCDALLATAAEYYRQALDLHWLGRSYYECAALTGLARVKFRRNEASELLALIRKAESLALESEYNDLLASLHLIQGHLAVSGRLKTHGRGLRAALQNYQKGLVYAMRFNRFLLDEVLSGRPQGSYLIPIIPQCLAQGEEGHRLLIALRKWWERGYNDTGISQSDTISPLAEGMLLLQAEFHARALEPGDGTVQTPVVIQIEHALQAS
jgi:tetratricopeptide (TPR) repeat protein